MNELLDAAQRQVDLEESRRWHLTEGKEGSPVSWYAEDLSDVDLSLAPLGGATLIDASFTRSLLDGADLSRTQAGGASFAEARLVDANFAKAVLAGARFDAANASGATFRKADLTRASFAGTALDSADLDGAFCSETSFAAANLTRASFVTTAFVKADLRNAELAGSRFDRTVIEMSTRFDGCTGLDTAEVVSIVVGNATITGEDARSLLAERAAPLPWSAEEFELYLLDRMGGDLAGKAALRLCPDEQKRTQIVTSLHTRFDSVLHAGIDYERVLGSPVARHIVDATGAFAGSTRSEFVLPLWPEVVFVVNTDSNGFPWGVRFEGGPTGLVDPDNVRPWAWTESRLREAASQVTVVDEWNDDLELELTFAARRFKARFKIGLLQSWKEIL